MGSEGKKPKILVTGMLNMKGDEIRFLAEQVSQYGGDVIIMDMSLGGEVDWADISLTEVLATRKMTKEKVWKSSRSDAIEMVGKAAALKVEELYKKGQVDGMISWAGTVGTSAVTIPMRTLPIGVPKIMLATAASGDVRPWLGNKDIYIANPIAEKGVNRVTRKAIANAAAAIVNMAKVGEIPEDEVHPLVALTAYGTTTPTVVKCEKHMEEKGWDTMIIHQVGTGATMEDLIRAGQINAVFEITPGELSNNMHKSIYGNPESWGGDRLTAASDMGIPQIVVPEWVIEEYRKGLRVSYQNSKKPYIHNPAVTALTPSLEETEKLAMEIISKLNRTKGPTALMVPMRGWSAYDQAAELTNIERGWAPEKGDGPVWWPDPEKPEWSRRASCMWAIFEKHVNRDNENLDIIQCDMHILDDSLVNLMNQCMDDMIDQKWKRGMYREFSAVVK